jgi:ABC-2 type transport system ATP-binding protein
MPELLEIDAVRRKYGQRTALDGVTLSAADGEVVAVLGVNGAGKTTLIRILSTLLLPSSGTARIAGYDVVRQAAAVRRQIGVVFGGDRGLYGRLSGEDNLRYFGVLRGVRGREVAARTEAIFEEVGLAGRARDRVETYSRGMKQRLHLAIGLLARPRLLMLDEPTIGLDVLEAHRIRQVIAAAAADGTTILLTSHNVEDLDALAQRVVLLRAGRIASDLPMITFRGHLGHVATIEVTGAGTPPTDLPPGAIASVDHGVWRLRVLVRSWSTEVFASTARAVAGHHVIETTVHPVGLEQVMADVLARSATPAAVSGA